MGEFGDRLKSRKFLLAIFLLAFYVVTFVFGLEVPQELQSAMFNVVLAYLGIEGSADLLERYKNSGKK